MCYEENIVADVAGDLSSKSGFDGIDTAGKTAVVCEKCPEGFLTAGQSPTGFATGMGSTNIAPDICYDGRDLFLAFEEVWAVTRNLMMRGEYQNIKAAKVLVLRVFVLCALDSNKDCMCQSHGRCQILNRASMILLLFSKE